MSEKGSSVNQVEGTASNAGYLLFSCCAILTLCLVVGLPTIRADNYFLGDDFGLVHHLHNLRLDRLLHYFYSDWTEGIYGETYDELRPFLALTYWLDSHLFGATNALGYHATNVVLHAIVSLLVFGIARAVAPSQKGAALLAAALFVLMPSHAEPIAWISGRVDSLAALFYLGAFLSFVQFRLSQGRKWLAATVLIFACGLFTKQSLVTLPILIVAYDAVYRPGERGSTRRDLVSRYAPYVPLFLLLVGYLALRYTLFGNALREDFVTLTKVKEFAFRQYFYVKNLLPIPRDMSFATRASLGALTIAVLAVCGSRMVLQPAEYRPAIRRVLFFGAIWYAITVAPMIVTYETARHLYVTAAGFSIALASLILPERLNGPIPVRSTRVVVAATLAVLYAVALSQNIRTWIENGVQSQKYATALPGMLRSLPPGSIVLLGIPPTRHDAHFWSWGLPFALQTPFLADNLYAQFEIIERPAVYCCPPKQWWSAKQRAITSLWNSPDPREITAIFPSPDNPGALQLTSRRVSGPALRLKIESAMGKSVDSLSAHMTPDETRQLAQRLLE